MLSAFRILIIPVFIWSYFEYREINILIPIAVLLLSAFTDIIDGIIARRFNMITQLGKFLDPLADKLTTFAVVVCISITYPVIVIFVVIYFVKELLMLIGGIILIKNGYRMKSARWFGKFTTVFLYCMIVTILIIPNPSTTLLFWLVVASVAVVITCLILYIPEYNEGMRYIKSKQADNGRG